MATSATNLSACSPAAEKALFSFPTWAVVDTGTAANTATVTGITGQQHCLTHLTVSLSAAPSAATVIQVKDGSTVIWQVQVATESRVITENFETRPLHASTGADLVITCGSAGGTTTQTVSACGFTIKAP